MALAQFTVATVSGEWMNDWFVRDADEVAWRDQFSRDGVVCDTHQTAGLLAGLLDDLDADIVAVQEAPSRAVELGLFLDTHLSANGQARYRFLLGDSGGSQKLALLFKPSLNARLVSSSELAGLTEPWLADVDGDAMIDEYQFTRNPLVCRVDLDAGASVEAIVAHLKSNFINGGDEMWNDPARRLEFVKSALRNRRRIANEGMQLRRYLDSRLDTEPSAAIVVLGDFNDGPGRDLFEQQYLAHNVTDLLVGSPYRPETLFGHALTDMSAPDRFTAVFDDFVTGESNNKLLLDHIITSPAMTGNSAAVRRVAKTGRIEHDAWAAHLIDDGNRRDQRATDHRPATVIVET